MKFPLIAFFAFIGALTLSGCESMPDKMKDDGREAADRAKASADKAYDDMKEDMK